MSNEERNEVVRSKSVGSGNGLLTMELIKQNKVLYDFNDMMLNFINYKNSLAPLLELHEGDKLGVDEVNQLYIDKKTTFQNFKRWYYEQGRDKSMVCLVDILKEYCLLNEMIVRSLRSTNKVMLRLNSDKYMKFLIQVLEFNNQCESGLRVLCETYKKDTEYVDGLNKLIDNLQKKSKILRISIVV